MGGAIGAEIIPDHRGVVQNPLAMGALAVQDPERVGGPAALAVLAQALPVDQEQPQGRLELHLAPGAAQGIDQQAQLPRQQPFEDVHQEQDDFHVQLRRLHPVGLAVDLVKLAKASLLGPLVAEHGPQGIEFLDPGALLQAVFQDGPEHRGGGLGPERQGVALAVGKGVHFLGHDVGVVADGAGEELGALEQRQTDLLVAVEVKNLPGHGLHPLPPGSLRRQDVPHAANRFNHVRLSPNPVPQLNNKNNL